MRLKRKIRSIARVGLVTVLGVVGVANVYNSVSFNNTMEQIRENPGSFGSSGDRFLYAMRYVSGNENFPNNILTILSRQEAEGFIEEVEKYPFLHDQNSGPIEPFIIKN